MDIKRRTFVLDDASVRADGDGPKLNFIGHAAVFNQRTYIGRPPFGFFEELERTAFDEALAERDDVRMLKNHNADMVLARVASGTLRLSKDETGLLNEADMAPTTYARDLAILLDRGDVNEMSFAFLPRGADGEEWTETEIEDPESGTKITAPLVRVKSVRLFDTSPVTFPAYQGTDAGLRQNHITDALTSAIVRGTVEIDGLEQRLLDFYLERIKK